MTRPEQFIVCLNTMGQDRGFTDDQLNFALRAAKEYRDRWEVIEQENLKKDIKLRMAQMDLDKVYKEHHETLDAAEFDKQVEEGWTAKEAVMPPKEAPPKDSGKEGGKEGGTRAL